MPAFVVSPGPDRAFIPEGEVELEFGHSPDFAAFESDLPAQWDGPPPHIHHARDEQLVEEATLIMGRPGPPDLDTLTALLGLHQTEIVAGSAL